MSSLRFDIHARSSRSRARAGTVHTAHGSFDTPAFMPVGTRGSVKGLPPGLVRDTGAQIILGNTYHLLLRPGPDLIHRLGGLQAFTGWRGPMLTDSGGYQAYSLAATNRIDEDGVTFKSIVDGSMVHLSPERAIDVQNLLGADIIMAFDDCPPSVDPRVASVSQERLHAAVERDRVTSVAGTDGGRDARPTKDNARPNESAEAGRPFARARTKAYDHAARLKLANERTVRWLERCKAAHDTWGGGAGARERSLFGIVQGGTDEAARRWCAERVCNIDLPGYAIGGVAVGEESEQIARVVALTAPLLPDAKPRYLMGVGYERDLLAAVLSGVDMFDCVLPTRNGRNANAFTSRGQVRLRNAQFAEDSGPIEEGCDCLACAPGVEIHARVHSKLPVHSPIEAGSRGETVFSRAYIRHLFMAQEMLGPILVSVHNLRHFQRFMADVRQTVATEDWEGLVNRWPVARAGLESARRAGLAC